MNLYFVYVLNVFSYFKTFFTFFKIAYCEEKLLITQIVIFLIYYKFWPLTFFIFLLQCHSPCFLPQVSLLILWLVCHFVLSVEKLIFWFLKCLYNQSISQLILNLDKEKDVYLLIPKYLKNILVFAVVNIIIFLKIISCSTYFSSSILFQLTI